MNLSKWIAALADLISFIKISLSNFNLLFSYVNFKRTFFVNPNTLIITISCTSYMYVLSYISISILLWWIVKFYILWGTAYRIILLCDKRLWFIHCCRLCTSGIVYILLLFFIAYQRWKRGEGKGPSCYFRGYYLRDPCHFHIGYFMIHRISEVDWKDIRNLLIFQTKKVYFRNELEPLIV